MLLVGRQVEHSACKNWVVGCWRGYLSGARCRLAYSPADATATHCACFSNIQIGFTFLVPAHPGSPGKGPLNKYVVCVCVCVCVCVSFIFLITPALQYYYPVIKLREGVLCVCVFAAVKRWSSVSETACNELHCQLQWRFSQHSPGNSGINCLHTAAGGSVAEWLACWNQAQKCPGFVVTL